MRKENVLIKIEKAEKLIESGKFLDAVNFLKKTKLPKFIESDFYFVLGGAFQGAGFFRKALISYEKVLAASCDPFLEIEALIGECACRRALGGYSKALKISLKTLNLAKKKNFLEREALLEYAMTLRLGGKFKEAKSILKDIKNAYLKEKDYQGLSFVYWAAGGMERLEGAYSKSADSFEKASFYAKKVGDKSMLGYALFGLGGVLRVAGKMDDSKKNYMKAKNIFSKSQDVFAIAYSECGLANVLRQLGDAKKAMEGYKRAFKLYKNLEDMPDLGFVAWGMGEIFKKKGKLKEALLSFKKAETYFSKGLEERGLALNSFSLAQTYYLIGDVKKADRIFDKAVAYSKSKNLHTYLEVFT